MPLPRLLALLPALALGLAACSSPYTPSSSPSTPSASPAPGLTAKVEALCASGLPGLEGIVLAATGFLAQGAEVPTQAGAAAGGFRRFGRDVEMLDGSDPVTTGMGSAATSAAVAFEALATAASAGTAAGPGSDVRRAAYIAVSTFWGTARSLGVPGCVPAGLDSRFDTQGETFAGSDPAGDCLAAFALDDAQSRLFLDAQTGALTAAEVGDGVRSLAASLRAASERTTGGLQAGLSTAAADMARFDAAVRSTGAAPTGVTQESLLAGTATALKACGSTG